MPGASRPLDIRPHSHRLSGLAAAGLLVLGAAAFASGLGRQLEPRGPSPFPATQLRAPSDQKIAEAEPAPVLQAAAPLRAHKIAAADDSAPPAAAPNASGAAQDTAASAPDAPTPAAAPAASDDASPQTAPAPQPDLDPPT
ncbi:hypothetical protein [Phenylobacterium sp.]|uniref:hypothetical protein n=1 Tax=Phenylobacterium sp. TaxID=1871053 RepID=UPI0011F5E40E|nr:hypothetical protein [Phenylobacterium sp.]THD63648.1 MAG: hypothetical protein E8A49_04625 [Phenylobacterium sp.]